MFWIWIPLSLTLAIKGLESQGLSYVSPYAPAKCRQTRPPGYAWDNEGSLGIWHQYMYGPPNNPLGENLTNPVEVNRGIGWRYDSRDTIYVESSQATGRQNIAPHSCWAAYAVLNTSCNGFCYAYGYFGGLGTGDQGTSRTFYKLYLDPNFLYVKASCFTEPDTSNAEKCDMPAIAIFTRKMRKDITPLEDVVIRDILDDRLQLYCLTSKDMVYVQWLDLPPCEYVEKPQAALDDYKYAQENWVSKCKKPGASTCSPAS